MFRASLRTAVLTLPVCAGIVVSGNAISHTEHAHPVADKSTDIKSVPGSMSFDTKGFPAKVQVNTKAAKGDSLMHLAGVGMRRKNFYVASVDVYQVGCYVSTGSLQVLKSSQQQAVSGTYSSELVSAKGGTSPREAKVMISLRFVREVSNAQVADAFNESFADLDPQSVATFKAALNKSNSSGSIKKGEELSFIWLEDKSLAIAHQGIIHEVANLPSYITSLIFQYL